MGKKSRRESRRNRPVHTAKSDVTLVTHPFAGLAGECDWVALREIVPAATATVRTTAEHGGRDVTVATLLPMAWAALHRQDGEMMLGLQVPGGSGDPSRDLAAALLVALASEPGNPVTGVGLPGPGLRLQDVLDREGGFDVRVHEGFDFWIDAETSRTPEVEASMQRANDAVVPTERLASVEAAYWCRVGTRTHLRWVLPYEEEALLDAIARLHVLGGSSMGEGTRYIGAFRAHGLVVPVWDLAPEAVADDVEQPAAEFGRRLGEALADGSDLTVEQRRARAGLASRQLTLR